MPTLEHSSDFALPDAFRDQCPEHQVIALTLPDAAKVAGLSIRTLYALHSDGRLPIRKIGRRSLILRRDLEDLLNAAPVADFGGAA